MFHFRHKESGVVYGVLIDISSGTVGVAIVASELGSTLPKLIYTHRITMRITKHGAERSENIRRVREALLSASLIISQEGMQALSAYDSSAKISKLYVTCSSPWSYTLARTVAYKNDTPFKVTNSLIGDLIQSAESEILEYLDNIPHVAEHSFNVVERATVDITINDYPVINPLDKQGTTLGLTHIAGLVPEEILESIREVQQKLFPDTKLRTHTYMLVMYCVLRDIFSKLDSLCIVDLMGEATEFALVEHKQLIENIFIPEGSNSFIRDVMEHTGKPAEDVQTLMTQDSLHFIHHDFDAHITTYEQSVTGAIERMREHHIIPTSVVITVQRPYEHFFVPILERAFRTILGVDPEILSIKHELIDEISHGAGDDVYLALGARFFHKLHGCGEFDAS